MAGAGVAWFLLAIYYRIVNRDVDDLILPLLTHGGIWGTVGAVGGLAFGIGRGERRQLLAAILGGLLGALAATLLYEVIGGLAFPLAKTTQPAPLRAGPPACSLACSWRAAWPPELALPPEELAETEARPRTHLRPCRVSNHGASWRTIPGLLGSTPL